MEERRNETRERERDPADEAWRLFSVLSRGCRSCGNGGLICLSEQTDRTSRARTRAGGGSAFSLTVLKKRERHRQREGGLNRNRTHRQSGDIRTLTDTWRDGSDREKDRWGRHGKVDRYEGSCTLCQTVR